QKGGGALVRGPQLAGAGQAVREPFGRLNAGPNGLVEAHAECCTRRRFAWLSSHGLNRGGEEPLSVPSATACRLAPCPASRWVALSAPMAFSPLTPSTNQRAPSGLNPATSPTDRPARCSRAKDSSTLG